MLGLLRWKRILFLSDFWEIPGLRWASSGLLVLPGLTMYYFN